MSENITLPLISVVITAKNERDTIENCILSILDQSYPNFELIFVDAKSFDNTFEKANRLKNIIESKKNCKGYIVISKEADTPGIGRNWGVKNAKGSIIAFIDADCVAEKDWLTNLVSHLPIDAGIVGGPSIIKHFKKSKVTTAIDSVLSTYLGSGGSPQFYRINKDCDTYAVSSCNMAIQKVLFEKFRGFNELLRYNEDSDLCNRIRKNGYRIVYTPSARVNHFLGIECYSDFISYFYTYGSERGKNVVKDSRLITKFNILSFVTVVVTISLLVLSFFVSWAPTVLVLLITFLILIILVVSLKIAITSKSIVLLFLSLAIFLTLHITYNVGFVLGYVLGIRSQLHII